MGLLKKIFVTKNSQDPERLYRRALELFDRDRFKDAANYLEKTVKIKPTSAVYFTLGATYSRIAGEFGDDENKIRPWAEKSKGAFSKAVNLNRQDGCLEEKQLGIAKNAVLVYEKHLERMEVGASSTSNSLEVGFLFDIDILGSLYGQAAWSIVMNSFEPINLCGCTFLSGDVDYPGSNRPYTYCIAIQTTNEKCFKHIENVLSHCDSDGLLPRDKREIIAPSSLSSLRTHGFIDSQGRFKMTDDACLWMFLVADKCGWRYLPSSNWLGYLAVRFTIETHWRHCDTFEVVRKALIEAGKEKSINEFDKYVRENAPIELGEGKFVGSKQAEILKTELSR